MDNKEISIKVLYTRESLVRRFTIDRDTSFDQLMQQLHLNNVGKQHEGSQLSIKYQDEEGDWISCSTQDEWEEAKSCPVDLLRINVIHNGSTALAVINDNLKKGEEMSREVVEKFREQATFFITTLQKEMDSERVQKGKDILKEVKEGLHLAFHELIEGLINSNNTQNSDLIRVDDNDDDVTVQQPQPLPVIPDPEPEPVKLDDFDVESDLSSYSSSDESSIEELVPEPEPEPEPVIEPEPMPVEDVNTIVMDVEEEPAAIAVPADFKYLQEVHMLDQMGFKDVETNMKLLLKHRGNVSKVVAVLLK